MSRSDSAAKQQWSWLWVSLIWYLFKNLFCFIFYFAAQICWAGRPSRPKRKSCDLCLFLCTVQRNYLVEHAIFFQVKYLSEFKLLTKLQQILWQQSWWSLPNQQYLVRHSLWAVKWRDLLTSFIGGKIINLFLLTIKQRLARATGHWLLVQPSIQMVEIISVRLLIL